MLQTWQRPEHGKFGAPRQANFPPDAPTGRRAKPMLTMPSKTSLVTWGEKSGESSPLSFRALTLFLVSRSILNGIDGYYSAVSDIDPGGNSYDHHVVAQCRHPGEGDTWHSSFVVLATSNPPQRLLDRDSFP